MNRLIFYIVLLTISCAQTYANRLWVLPFEIKAGETKAIDIYLTMDEEPYTGFQFDMRLPEGLEIEKTNSGELMFTLLTDRLGNNDEASGRTHSVTSNYADGYYTVVVSSERNTLLKGKDGAILTMQVKAAKDVHVDKLTASVTGIKLGRITETSDNFASEPFAITTTKELHLKMGTNGYDTYACDNNFRMISGAKIYTGAYSDGNVALYDVGDNTIVPAGEGVMLLRNEENEIVILATGEDANIVENNDLVGVTQQTTSLKSGYNYVLKSIEDDYYFAPATTDESVRTLMNKAYINTGNEHLDYITINGSTPDRIISIADNSIETQKYLKNKNVRIKSRDGIYTVDGKKIK